ncbi:hypothetical protein [uncultured Maribacter sp.]|uniref:hypothetical protein n=1 Tax=uncultured Maribacter sp. TaxID=431308 RepID=UPI0030EB2C50|tara:strand:- start:42130 stop:42309 length:180 start_codon:yes stop_codon:yes gene_type:complete
MSVGNPKKLRFAEGLDKKDVTVKSAEAGLEDVALVHKNKNHRVIRELSFESKMNNSKLV